MSIFRESFLEESYMFDYMIESINVELLQEAFDKEKIINGIKKLWKKFVKWFKEKCKKIREFINKILKKNNETTDREETIENIIEYKCISDDTINKFKKFINTANNIIGIKIDLNNKTKMEDLLEKLEDIGNISNELKEYEDITILKKGSDKDLKDQNKKLSNLCKEIDSLIADANSYINDNTVTYITNSMKDRINNVSVNTNHEDLKSLNELIIELIRIFKLIIIDFEKYSLIINSVINYNNSL